MTNRDKINDMSNDRLADILSRVDNAYNIRCKFCSYWGKDCFLTGWNCSDGIKAWLDAPVKNPEKQPTDNKARKLSVELDKILWQTTKLIIDDLVGDGYRLLDYVLQLNVNITTDYALMA